jgi:hypothetical protein
VADLCVLFVVLISVVGFVGSCSYWQCVVLSSNLFVFFSPVSGRRCILVIWYLKAAVLCSKGWLDSKLIVVSVVVGFLCMSISRCGAFGLCSGQESFFPFSSCVGLSFMLLCIWFMWVSMSFGCILLESYMIKISSIYLV